MMTKKINNVELNTDIRPTAAPTSYKSTYAEVSGSEESDSTPDLVEVSYSSRDWTASSSESDSDSQSVDEDRGPDDDTSSDEEPPDLLTCSGSDTDSNSDDDGYTSDDDSDDEDAHTNTLEVSAQLTRERVQRLHENMGHASSKKMKLALAVQPVMGFRPRGRRESETKV